MLKKWCWRPGNSLSRVEFQHGRSLVQPDQVSDSVHLETAPTSAVYRANNPSVPIKRRPTPRRCTRDWRSRVAHAAGGKPRRCTARDQRSTSKSWTAQSGRCCRNPRCISAAEQDPWWLLRTVCTQTSEPSSTRALAPRMRRRTLLDSRPARARRKRDHSGSGALYGRSQDRLCRGGRRRMDGGSVSSACAGVAGETNDPSTPDAQFFHRVRGFAHVRDWRTSAASWRSVRTAPQASAAFGCGQRFRCGKADGGQSITREWS